MDMNGTEVLPGISYKRLYEAILETVPFSIFILDANLKVLEANRNFLKKSRQHAKDVLGRRIEEVFPRVFSESTDLIGKVQNSFSDGDCVREGKLTYKAPGIAATVYYYLVIPLLEEGARPSLVMLLLEDITEKERLGAEVRSAWRHWASAVESVTDIIFSATPDGTIQTWNKAAEEISGYKPRALRGIKVMSLCVDESEVEKMERAFRALALGAPQRDLQIDLRDSKGQRLPVSWSFSALRDDTGHLSGIVAVGRDLTERKRMEAQLIQTAKMAAMGVMAGGIAHEIRNPLAVSSSAAQLLLDDHGDGQFRKEAAQKIYTNIAQASRIIENLLRFARPSSGAFEVFPLEASLDEIVSLVSNQLILSQITLVKRYGKQSLRVRGIKNLLQQVFLNITLNAVNAMREGGGELLVATRCKTGGERRSVLVSFTDQGCGIPRENLSRIFDPFFTTQPVGQGTGLGLSVSYSIVKQMGGCIHVTSEVGSGSTFEVELPLEP
ncbi:MAG: PAS domain S-box protein [Candidatus Tectomicrobia bacterium]|nr:PAS domain S-box protein [Candidatus Tectomicrobia bacterium]